MSSSSLICARLGIYQDDHQVQSLLDPCDNAKTSGRVFILLRGDTLMFKSSGVPLELSGVKKWKRKGGVKKNQRKWVLRLMVAEFLSEFSRFY